MFLFLQTGNFPDGIRRPDRQLRGDLRAGRFRPPVRFLILLPVEGPEHSGPVVPDLLQALLRRADLAIDVLERSGRQDENEVIVDLRILRSPPIRRVPQGVCKLLLRQDENGDLQAKPTLDHALDLPGQRRGLRFLAGKDHVPAVQPGPDVRKPERFKAQLQFRHRHLALPADVHAPQQGDIPPHLRVPAQPPQVVQHERAVRGDAPQRRAVVHLPAVRAGIKALFPHAMMDRTELVAERRLRALGAAAGAVDHLRGDRHPVELRPQRGGLLPQGGIVRERCDSGIAFFAVQPAAADQLVCVFAVHFYLPSRISSSSDQSFFLTARQSLTCSKAFSSAPALLMMSLWISSGVSSS